MVTKFSLKINPLEIRGLSHANLGVRSSHELDNSGQLIGGQNYKHLIKQKTTPCKAHGCHVISDTEHIQERISRIPPSGDLCPLVSHQPDKVPGLLLERRESTMSSTLTRSDSSSTRTAVASWLQLDEMEADVIGLDDELGWLNPHLPGQDSDRTSVSSSEWGDDICEHDRQESNRVLSMFKDIEYILFGDESVDSVFPDSPDNNNQGNHRISKLLQSETPVPTPSPVFARHCNHSSSHLVRECRDWVSKFPHMRVLGQQVIASRDLGYSHHVAPKTSENERMKKKKKSKGKTLVSKLIDESNSNFGSPRSIQKNSLAESDSISLLGHHLTTVKSPRENLTNQNEVSSNVNNRPQSLSVTSTYPEEEDILTEGCYEEIIAIDFENDIMKSSTHPFKMASRPPNHKYPPVTPGAAKRDTILNDLFQHQWSRIVHYVKPLIIETLSTLHQSREGTLLSCESFSSLPPIQHRNMEGRDFLAKLKTSPEHHSSSQTANALAGLIQITSKPLQQRERSSLFLPELPEPGSSLIGSQIAMLHDPSSKISGRLSMPLLASSSTSSINNPPLLANQMAGSSTGSMHQLPVSTVIIDKPGGNKGKLLGGRLVPLSSGRFTNLDFRNRAKAISLSKLSDENAVNKSIFNTNNDSKLLPSLVEETAADTVVFNPAKLKLASHRDLPSMSRPGSSQNGSIFSPRVERYFNSSNTSFAQSNPQRNPRAKVAISRSSLAPLIHSSNSTATVNIGRSGKQSANQNGNISPAWGSNNSQSQLLVNSQRRGKQLTHSLRL